MEVNFRPLPPSDAVRRTTPGQVPSSDEGQNFMEIIESLTSSENNPEANEQPGKKKDASRRAQQGSANMPAPEEPAQAPPDAESEAPQGAGGEKKLGSHFDVLA